MTRKEELTEIICRVDGSNRIKAAQLIDEIIFIEEQLAEVRKLPLISYNPKNPLQQRATPAAKMYKELLQQYNNSLRLLFKLSGDMGGETEEESPLRKWLKNRKGLDDEF